MRLNDLELRGWNVLVRNHARAILCRDFHEATEGLCDVCGAFTLESRELIRGGGGESSQTQRLRRALTEIGWEKRNVRMKKVIDGRTTFSSSHEIDHFIETDEGSIALEIEWNNKDPFFDRDLENFERLHGNQAISVGVIVTRGNTLQENMETMIRSRAELDAIAGFDDLLARYSIRMTEPQQRNVERRGGPFLQAWAREFTASKFGTSTTHWGKLQDRVDRGVGGTCPLLLLGIPASAVVDLCI